jgi:transcriptional regulator EpsA
MRARGSNVARIRHHYELFLLLQGEIQHFISHQILIAAWGDFRDSNPTFDIVSALPHVRTHEIGGCGSEVERMLKDAHAYWVANGRRQALLNNANFKSIASSTCDCALHQSMRRTQSILVHGIRNERDQTDSIYVALDSDSVTNGRSIKRFLPIVDPLITQIDVAFQKIGALKPADASAKIDDSSNPGDLTKREREVIRWIAEGRTNAEIGAILGISSCTVKIHLHTILLKLGASNRTEAVFKFKEYGSRK